MADASWMKALVCAGDYETNKRRITATSWPDSLTITQIVCMQYPNDRTPPPPVVIYAYDREDAATTALRENATQHTNDLREALAAAMWHAAKGYELPAMELKMYLTARHCEEECYLPACATGSPFDLPESWPADLATRGLFTHYIVPCAALRYWFAKQGIEPSVHIRAWFATLEQAERPQLPPQKPRQRSDDMAHEVARAVCDIEAEGGEATPAAVMETLKASAGQADSCVIEAAPDGVIWRRASGQPEKLTLAALRGRLARAHAKAR